MTDPAPPAAPAAPPSAWAPLAHKLFLALFLAQLASNVGTWMQNVGAQLLMVKLDPSPLPVALVQTATSLPILMVALPAGVLGDLIDRRKLLIASQTVMFVAAAVLAVLTATDHVTPSTLLWLTFMLGLGNAVTIPAWSAIQPELVPRVELRQAAALNGVNINLARAVGPAIGGLIVAAVGAEAVFALNALSFIVVIVVLFVWRRTSTRSSLGPERAVPALRAGLRYIRNSPRFRAVLVRSAVFIACASALWALLPLVAVDQLELGSGGYGILLGSLGVGALLGAALLPRLQKALPLDRIVLVASLMFAVSTLVVATVSIVGVALVALLVGGCAWIFVLASMNGTAQTILPAWVRARALAAYVLVFQGGQGIGALLWGVVADRLSVRGALIAAGLGLVFGLSLARWHRLQPLGDFDPSLSLHWPEPAVVLQPEDHTGPVLVTLDFRVAADQVERFLAAMEPVGRARRRSGASEWGVFRDAAEPDRFLETFVVPSWEDHLRQHSERGTETDRRFEAAARELALGEPVVSHLFLAR
ncbi:MFS transporter [soil metagenome]